MLRKTLFVAVNTMAALAPGSSFGVTLPNGMPFTANITESANDAVSVAAVICSSINMAAITSENKPVKAVSVGVNIYVVMVTSSDYDGVPSSHFTLDESMGALSFPTAWERAEIENPYVDPADGLFTRTQVVATAVAVATIAAIVR